MWQKNSDRESDAAHLRALLAPSFDTESHRSTDNSNRICYRFTLSDGDSNVELNLLSVPFGVTVVGNVNEVATFSPVAAWIYLAIFLFGEDLR